MAYNPKKAAQTIAFFAMQGGGQLNVMKAVKLVYLSDRESVARRGHPIQDEPRYSLPHGPINSTTLDYLNGAYRDDGGWSNYLTDRDNHFVGLTDDKLSAEALDMLSEAELGILADVWKQFGHMDRFDLSDWTHDPENVPEWRNPNGSSIRITLEQMMQSLGLNGAKQRAAEVESLDRAGDFLASL